MPAGVTLRSPVVLVGLPGAGKSTAGALAAAHLGVAFVDIDRVVERSAGQTVAAIFATSGELRFRRLEAAALEAALAGPAAVIAPGGGWAAQPGALERAAEAGAFIIHLAVSPEAAAARLAHDRNHRPLLAGPDPVGRLRKLQVERRGYYAQAAVEIRADDGGPELIARRIAEAVRRHAP